MSNYLSQLGIAEVAQQAQTADKINQTNWKKEKLLPQNSK